MKNRYMLPASIVTLVVLYTFMYKPNKSENKNKLLNGFLILIKNKLCKLKTKNFKNVFFD